MAGWAVGTAVAVVYAPASSRRAGPVRERHRTIGGNADRRSSVDQRAPVTTPRVPSGGTPMSVPAHPELGFYTLAGAPKSPRDLIAEVREAEALGPRHRVHLRALQHQGGVRRCRARSARCRRRIAHRHRRHQPQHPPPDGHRRPTPRRCTASPAAGSPSASGGASTDAAGRLRHPPHHHRADGGLRRADAPALAGRGRSSATTGPAGIVARCCTSTRTSTRTSRSRLVAFGPELAGARRPGLRRRRPPHLLHRRDPRALRGAP